MFQLTGLSISLYSMSRKENQNSKLWARNCEHTVKRSMYEKTHAIIFRALTTYCRRERCMQLGGLGIIEGTCRAIKMKRGKGKRRGKRRKKISGQKEMES